MRVPKRLSILLIATQAAAQVVDVNGDGTVGAEEVIALAEQWKGPASESNNNHDHLGQTWTGNRNPLVIRGDFPPRIVIGPAKTNQKGFSSSPSAPLILDNTALPTNGYHHPDLILRGGVGMISAEQPGGELALVSNGNVWAWLDSDDNSTFSTFSILNSGRAAILGVRETGDMSISGTLRTSGGEYKIDHPADPANKYLVQSSVSSPEMKNVYDGVVMLDEKGEATVDLPAYFEALNCDFRYQLTCIGGFAPVYISEEIQGNRFTISGGSPGLKVSWMVTGIRHDAYAKASPIEVVQEKSKEEKGRFLHPELFGETVEKKIGIVQSESGNQ